MSLTNVVKTAVLSLGVTLSLAASQAGQAQISIKFVGGGSSALQGDYRASSYGPGAIPQAVQAIGSIGAYKSAVQNEHVVLIRSVDPSGDSNAAGLRYVLTGAQATQANTVQVSPDDLVAQINPTVPATDPTAKFEVINDAMIRTTLVSGTTNVMVLLRTDSGQGVRYVANAMKLVQFPTNLSRYSRVTPDAPTFGPYTFTTLDQAAPGGFDFTSDKAVVSNLQTSAVGSGVLIEAGFSDVSADTVYRYAGFSGLNPNPKGAFDGTPLAVLTLLVLHNSNITASNDFVVNIPRHFAQNITGGFAGPTVTASGPQPINWKLVDPRLPKNLIRNAYREPASGTRMTYLVDVLRHDLTPNNVITENIGNTTLAPSYSGGGANPQLGTGTMINTLNGASDAYGYSFVTGGAGNGKPNIRVAAFDGVLPFRRDPTAASPNYVDLSGTSISLPGNNGQKTYAAAAAALTPYYTEVVNGRYPLWSFANGFTTKTSAGIADKTILTDITGAFSVNPGIAYGVGLTLIDDLNTAGTFRSFFTSTLTDETVTDGLIVNFDPIGSSLPNPVVQ